MAQSPYNPFAIPDDEEQRYADAMAMREAQLDPGQMLQYRVNQGDQGIQRGFGRIADAITGAPPQFNQQNAAKAAMAEIRALPDRPGTKEFFTKAAAIFQKHGLVQQAQTMQAAAARLDADSVELEGKRRQYLSSDEKLLERFVAAEEKARASGDPRLPEIQARLKTLQDRLASGKKEGQGMSDLAKAEAHYADVQQRLAADPNNPELREALSRAKERVEIKSGRKMDAATEARVNETREMGAMRRQQAEFAMEEKKRKYRDEAITVKNALIAAAYELAKTAKVVYDVYTHSELNSATGRILGALPPIVGRLISNAASKIEQLRGRTFLSALQKLKSTSTTGASGLGQLTELEGEKIQNAEIPMSPQTDTDVFKARLAEYYKDLQHSYGLALRNLSSPRLLEYDVGGIPTMQPLPSLQQRLDADPRSKVRPESPVEKPRTVRPKVGPAVEVNPDEYLN